MKTGNTFFAMAVIAILGITAISCGNDDTHTHAYSAAWQTNETQHWKECSCGEKNETANHTFDNNGVCMCGYEQQKDWEQENVKLPFGDNLYMKMEGIDLTPSEWGNAKTAIMNKIKTSYDETSDEEEYYKQEYYELIFPYVTTIIEKTPVGYENYKVVNGPYLYVNIAGINNLDIKAVFTSVDTGVPITH